mmetsp:Transcript_56040/g.63949  ORF Transcript_56040/g.63949 Transcript_56040/m.63949 type:complete len:204 (+) Transcript_56040:71-682(+)
MKRLSRSLLRQSAIGCSPIVNCNGVTFSSNVTSTHSSIMNTKRNDRFLSHKNYLTKRCFSSDNSKDPQEEEDSHDDFKPKTHTPESGDEDFVQQQIEEWVKENKIVLFMKGVPQQPQCGFSNFVVQLMRFYKIKDFKAINVLANPAIREGIKKYSDWPTIPQLYIDGEFVGGCDIVQDMHKDGSFKELLIEKELWKGTIQDDE